MSILLRGHLRYFWRHPWLLSLSILGVALGVAVVVSVDLASHSAIRSFELSSGAVAGRSTHRIIGPEGVPEGFYTKLRVQFGVRRSAPVIEGTLELGSRSLRVLGLDPLAEEPFREVGFQPAGTLETLLAPGSVFVAESTARELHLRAGSPVEFPGGTGVIRGLLSPADERSRIALEDTLLCDVSVAQELLDRDGFLSRIDLILEDEQVEAVRSLLPAGLELVSASAQREAATSLSRTFHLNLQALSLLSLGVGLFLIYNIVSFSVVHRQAHFGRLRSLGVLRSELFWGVVSEASLLGLVGAALGVAAGTLMAQSLVHLVAQTIDEFYHRAEIHRVLLEPWILGKGCCIGVLGAVLAAVPGGLQATRALPATSFGRSSLEFRARRLAPRAALAGASLLLTGALILRFGPPLLSLSLAAALCLLLGAALTTPWLLSGLIVAAQPALSRWLPLPGRMALRGVRATLSRTGVAAAALTLAIAAAVGMGVMVDSFRATLVDWLDFTLQADLYLTNGLGRDRGSLPVALAEQVRDLPGVEAVSTNQSRMIPSEHGETEVNALSASPKYRRAFRFLGTPADAAWDGFERGEVFVSEPYAYRYGLVPGDEIWLLTPRGRRSFRVAAVYYSYAPAPALLTMSRQIYDRHWEDPLLSGIGIEVQEGVDRADLTRRLQAARPGVLVTPTAQIKAFSLRIFERTFDVTRVLQLLVLCVALLGILTAVTALGLERVREIAVLRALGFTPGQVYGLLVWQSGLMGLFCGLLSIPWGLALAWVIIEYVNKRAFGWTLYPAITAAPLLLAPVLGFGVALLAALYPAAALSRSSTAAGLREE
ncbi:MAG: ABC transporter permease [Armatimonadetes bacterium]|nr:ABC transporter permease [Armatimonadota bacterium]